MEGTQKITKRKLSDDVLDQLIELIQSGLHAPGDTSPSERQLMEQFGVGRPAVPKVTKFRHLLLEKVTWLGPE